MKSEIFSELKGQGEIQPIFEGIQVHTEMRDTLSLTSITQSYRNPSTENMEVVYTFPLPLDAVLLEVTVTLGEKTLQGTVLPKQEAENNYEEAITDGDAPVMLQNTQPGIYTMNVGNLLPGEKAQIRIRYGMFHRWQRDTLRYHLPTTIAPRYGSAAKAGLAPHQEPETSLLAENLFAFDLVITGSMAGMSITSPSHEITVARKETGEESVIGLARNAAFMDRDLIIAIKKAHQGAATARMEKDGDHYIVWGSFQPQFAIKEELTPRSIKIVVDCSGSMSGDSIAQAREALLRILDELRPQDWFNIVAFGSSATPLFDAQTKADSKAVAHARGFLKNMDANMGGTEIGQAIEMAARFHCPEQIQQDILLITDGEVWGWEEVVANALEGGHRFFTVGVGCAVSEAFVKTLAERTGGACELVSPNENMADRIHRHFKRIGTPRAKKNEMTWPAEPLSAFPAALTYVYDGDTCNIFAWFAEPPAGEIQMKISLPDNSEHIVRAVIGPCEAGPDDEQVIARMAAALKLREISEEGTGQDLAMKYQLVSRWTHYLAIEVRAEGQKATTLPSLHTVPQMMAAGWSGCVIKRVADNHECYHCITRENRSRPGRSKSRILRNNSARRERLARFFGEEDLQALEGAWRSGQQADSAMRAFVELLDMSLAAGVIPRNINLPLLPTATQDALRLLVDEGADAETVVLVFLNWLAESEIGAMLSRQAKRVIAKAYKDLQVEEWLAKHIEERLRTAASPADCLPG